MKLIKIELINGEMIDFPCERDCKLCKRRFECQTTNKMMWCVEEFFPDFFPKERGTNEQNRS